MVFFLAFIVSWPLGKGKKIDMGGESGMIHKGVLAVFVKTPFYDQKRKRGRKWRKK